MKDLTVGRDAFVIHGSLSYTAAAPRSERLPVFEVPLADRRWFWGRQDLLEGLEAASRSQRSVALTQTLSGLGGVGKSQLAAQFAYRHRGELDVVWWVSCTPAAGGELDARALARARFGALGTYLGLPPGEDPEARVAEVRRWLETTDRRWLIVFDDAPEWSAIEAMVPQRGSGLTLITSRNAHWDLVDGVVKVGVFDLDTAAAFLQARAGIDDPAGGRALADALGGLALALEQAGAFLAHSPVPLGFADYLDALRRRGLRLFQGTSVDDYDYVVGTVWEESFAAVNAHNPHAAKVLELLAVLAPVPVPAHMLMGAASGKDAVDIAAALEQLERYSLVTAASETVVVHQLVHRALTERLNDKRHSAARTRAIRLLDAAFPNAPRDPRTWEAAAALTPHVFALFAEGGDGADLLGLVERAAFYLQAQADYPSARQFQESVLIVRREMLGERHLDTLMAANNVARTLWAQGELARARQLQEEVLAVRRETLGERHADTITAAGNLAETLRSQGELVRARQLQEDVLAVRTEVLGDRHLDTLRAAGNLARTLWAQGDLVRARQLQEQVLAVRREVLGERHPDTLGAVRSLARTLWSEGDYPFARHLQEEVLAASREVWGDRHPDTLRAANNLARTLWSQGDYPSARQLQEEVLTVRREVLGNRHPDTLLAAGNLAETLWAQGELVHARQLQNDVLATSREVLGEHHPDTLVAAGNLARMLWVQDERSRADELRQEFGVE